MQFDLFRLSLLERRQLDAFERRKEDGSRFSREEWLRALFSKEFSFLHWGSEFHYVPTGTIVGGYIAARVGRQVSVRENEPPENGLSDTERPSWRAAHVFLDPRHHDDGQKLGFQVLGTIGSPIAVITSMLSHLNQANPDGPYVIEVNPISDPTSFWEFVRENKGSITNIAFDFVAPNMFGSANECEREMRELREGEKARKVRFELAGDDLHLETDRINAAVEYTAKGGGTVRAKSKKKKSYNSKKKVKKIIIEVSKDMEDETSAIWVANLVAQVFET